MSETVFAVNNTNTPFKLPNTKGVFPARGMMELPADFVEKLKSLGHDISVPKKSVIIK